MGTTLATKQDLEILRLAMQQDAELLRRDVNSRFGAADRRFDGLEQKIEALRSDVARDLMALDMRMTIKLGSMLFVGFGLLIAALRLWN